MTQIELTILAMVVIFASVSALLLGVTLGKYAMSLIFKIIRKLRSK